MWWPASSSTLLHKIDTLVSLRSTYFSYYHCENSSSYVLLFSIANPLYVFHSQFGITQFERWTRISSRKQQNLNTQLNNDTTIYDCVRLNTALFWLLYPLCSIMLQDGTSTSQNRLLPFTNANLSQQITPAVVSYYHDYMWASATK